MAWIAFQFAVILATVSTGVMLLEAALEWRGGLSLLR
jgi:hypothetical protein